jgi:hypothetical protein
MVRFKVGYIFTSVGQRIPNLLFKNRWLLVEFIPCADAGGSAKRPNEINAKQIWSALKQSVLHNFGDTGWGAVGLSLTGTFVTVLYAFFNQHFNFYAQYSKILLSYHECLYHTSCARPA